MLRHRTNVLIRRSLAHPGLIGLADENYGCRAQSTHATRLLHVIVYRNYSTYADTNYEKVSVYIKFKA